MSHWKMEYLSKIKGLISLSIVAFSLPVSMRQALISSQSILIALHESVQKF